MADRSLEDIQDEILDRVHAGEPVDRAEVHARRQEFVEVEMEPALA